MRQPPGPVGQSPLTAADAFHLAGQRLPRHAVVLGQSGDLQARIQQRGDDLTQPVVPFVGDGVLEHHVGLDVGAGVLEDQRLLPLEIGVPHHQQVVLARVVQRPQHRVALTQEQPPAGPQQVSDHLGPAADVRQPAQRADTGEHQVKSPAPEHLGGRIDLSLHEPGIGADPLGQPPRLFHRRRREVQPGHRRPQPRQRHRVGADVTLQVHPAQPADGAQPGKVEPDDLAEETGIGSVLLQLVVRGGGMSRDPLIPAGPVDAPIVLHAGTIPPARGRETSRVPDRLSWGASH